MLAHEVCREVLHNLEAAFHMRVSTDENPRLFAADTGERCFDLPVPFSPGSRVRVTVADLGLDVEARWGLVLGESLRAQPLFHALLRVTADGAVTCVELVKRLSTEDFALRKAGDFHRPGKVLTALLALIAPARELRS